MGLAHRSPTFTSSTLPCCSGTAKCAMTMRAARSMEQSTYDTLAMRGDTDTPLHRTLQLGHLRMYHAPLKQGTNATVPTCSIPHHSIRILNVVICKSRVMIDFAISNAGYIKDGRACTSCQSRPVLSESSCTYRNVPQLVLSAWLNVVPGSRVVLS